MTLTFYHRAPILFCKIQCDAAEILARNPGSRDSRSTSPCCLKTWCTLGTPLQTPLLLSCSVLLMLLRVTDYFLENFSGPKRAKVCLVSDKEKLGSGAMLHCFQSFLDMGGSGMEDGSWRGRNGP